MNELRLDYGNLRKYLDQAFFIEKEYYEASNLVSELKKSSSSHFQAYTQAQSWLEDSQARMSRTRSPKKTILYALSFGLVAFIIYMIVYLKICPPSTSFAVGSSGSVHSSPNTTPLTFAMFLPLVAIAFIICMVNAVKEGNASRRLKSDLSSEIEKAQNAADYFQRGHQEYNNELRAAEKRLNKLESLKSKFYDVGVLHPKYRNFVAVSAIYTYIETGQSSTLTGPHGAYRMFEQDALQGAIITRLDIVISKMDEIITNQRQLIAAIKETNANISGLLNGIQSSIDRMASSVESSAYYQKKAYKEAQFQSDLMFWNSLSYQADRSRSHM